MGVVVRDHPRIILCPAKKIKAKNFSYKELTPKNIKNSGVEAKRGIELRQSIRDSAKIGDQSILTLGSLCLPCCAIQHETDLNLLHHF